jgi:DNA-binding NarL/FixJ family response regulator
MPTVVLIADDDFVMADRLEEILIEAGFQVCGIAATVEEAIALGERCHPDLGIIDVHLADGGRGTDVAAALRRRGPFGVLYSTGDLDCLNGAEGEGCLLKPYPTSSIVAALRIVGDLAAGRATTSVFPSGFRLLGQAPVLDGAA